MKVSGARQKTRMNTKAQMEIVGGNGLYTTDVEDLSVPLEHTSSKSFQLHAGFAHLGVFVKWLSKLRNDNR